jgi:2-polyprenyl-3-methyl-5-hydroxy-6-metoxy-1,4-benzoquinol methylase
MVNPEDIAERFWRLAQKPSEEARREQLFLDDVIHKAHLEREIGARLEGAETALDVGAGTGRFSLWLAASGVRVTHIDVSAGMIERAHRHAVKAGLAERMEFRQARLADIGGYGDKRDSRGLEVPMADRTMEVLLVKHRRNAHDPSGGRKT